MSYAHALRRRLAVVTAAAIAVGAAVVAPQADAAPLPPPDDWPRFVHQGIVTEPDEMNYNPTGEYIFPSIFHAGEHFDDPLGEWYLYLAPHNVPGGIVLMYADRLEGPWTEYEANPIISNEWVPHYSVSHVSGPDVIWNDEADALFLYYHGENSTTRYAYSDDGITFEYGGTVLTNEMGGPNVTQSSYARVFPHPDPESGYEYAMFYGGVEPDGRRIRLGESVDGIEWVIDPEPLIVPEGLLEGSNVSAADLWEWNGRRYIVYHGSPGVILAREIDVTLRQLGEPAILYLHDDEDGRPERVAAAEIVSHDGETYLFSSFGGSTRSALIAWAKHDPDAPPPGTAPEPQPAEPFGDFPVDPENSLFEECAAPGSDEFEGGLADGVWDRVLREGDARHEVRDGVLYIPTYRSGIAGTPLLQQELPDGQWQVTSEVTISPWQTYQQAGLLLYSADNRTLKFVVASTNESPPHRIELVFARPGAPNRKDTEPPLVRFATTVWLRLTSDGEAIRASISYDGATFSDFGRAVDVDTGAFTHVGPMALRGDTDAEEIEGAFEWFRFSPTVDEYSECETGTDPVDPVDPVDPSDLHATVTSATVRPGEPQTVTGTGFAPGERVDAVMYSSPLVIGDTTADADGAVAFTWTDPG